MIQGLITKLTGGLYTVKTDEGIVELKPKGVMRHENISPMVGDHVILHEGWISEVLDRKNQLRRPPISNIDQVLLVFSAVEPEFSFKLLDRLLAHASHAGIDPVIIVTKLDLIKKEQEQELVSTLEYYRSFAPIYLTSLANPNHEISKMFANKVSVFAGQSGVGKSTLINVLSGTTIETQAISQALGRGKHTTRHSELLPLLGGYVGDTPGFGSLDFEKWSLEDLRDSFSDFVSLADNCKFRGCYHRAEPGCAVKEHVLASRHKNYLMFMTEIDEMKKW